MVPEIEIDWPQAAFLSIEQSVVTFTLNEKSARIVSGFDGNGKVPKSYTIEPFGPRLGSK